ncbi:MAG: hypothetical protein R3C59_14040 [Planctomycetaceae bacterium]
MRRFLLLTIVWASLGAAWGSAADRSALTLLPETTVLYVEFPDPPQLISTIFDHPLRTRIEALEPYKAATQTDGYRAFHFGRTFLELQLGMKWREALETLTAHGIYAGVDSRTEGLVVLVHAKDAASLDLFRTKLLEISKLGKNPDQVREGEYRGIKAYEVDKTKFAVVDDWLVITNQGKTGQAVLDRLLDSPAECLANHGPFKTAREQRPDNATAWGYADLATLRDAGVAKKLFAGESENPAAELLVGGILSALQQTPYVTATLKANSAGLALELSMPHHSEWIPEHRVFYFGQDGAGKATALPQTQNTLFTLGTYRDVADMWLRAGDLFNEKINDGFAAADATLTTFFSGKDFAEDILGSLTPQIGFVATQQDFRHVLPVPSIKLPQFALVLQMKEPETMTREMRRTFQSMIGFFNVLGAMEGRPQLELNMEKLDGGAELISSVYIPEVGDEQSTSADVLFNFSPSVGFRDAQFVVASTDRLARELVQAPPAAADETPVNTSAKLYGGVLQTVLHDNREQLISQNMLEEGHSREEAEAAIALLLEFVGYFQQAGVTLDAEADRLSVRFDVAVQAE